MVPDSLKASLKAIHQELGLGSHRSWEVAMSNRADSGLRWYRSALTSLVFAAGSSAIRSVVATGEGLDIDEGLTVGGCILGIDRVTILDATLPAGRAPAEWSVTVRPLASLESVGVVADAEPFNETMDGEWPAVTSAVLTFRSGDVVRLVPSHKQGREDVAALVSTLLAHLS